ncbi:molybdenum cofactor guanylyltransferase MobA [Thiohalobacter thiocyanaticus]|uniref:Molybdenum cofactor guanylyltransferase n=1 Tax=Thiohalobacter thiocyanaticus TaxID=585455 RepID=A0A426QLQ3_9GAMM|nr:molybdenum cofactor guanylyltransferase MobA [Thiohalobacter thiocyanaticus]RRQ22703.1 molybdenum cofactor guanylyltransferase [Thiohalobacter thiocyanaticus]
MSDTDTARNDLTGLILAGGRARRMGGRDKGLIEVGGRALIDHAIASLRRVTPHILISANRHPADYASRGYPVLKDDLTDHPGPLAGILTALERIENAHLLVMPCDAPLATPALLQRLVAAQDAQGGSACLARDGERLQPTFCLLARETAPSLRRFLAAGERKTQLWLQSLDPVIVDCSDHPEWFANVNTPEDLQRIEAMI